MSDPNTSQKRDLSIFDNMSTERLQEYLDQDLLLPDEESDIEAVVYVLEVLARRKEEENDIDDLEVPTWEDFCKSLQKYSDDQFKEMGIDPNFIEQIIQTQYDDTEQLPPKQKSTPRRKIIALRTVAVAAILIAALLFGSLASYASGFDLFGAIAKWTQETFGFSTQDELSIEIASYPEQLSELHDLLIDNGATEKVLPRYLPDSYKLEMCDSYESEGAIVCLARLSSDECSINFRYRVFHKHENGYIYEKDIGDPEVYSANGIEYYISTNMGKYRAVWLYDNIECNISDVSSRNELIKIIDSIGE